MSAPTRSRRRSVRPRGRARQAETGSAGLKPRRGGRTARRAAARARSGAQRGARTGRRLVGQPSSQRVRRRRVALLVAVAAIALLYLLLVRNLAIVRVETVTLRGAGPAYAADLKSTLDRTAEAMTTLNVDEAALERVAHRYPAVVSLDVEAELLNRLVVTVVERPPVGEVRGERGRAVPVAADGTLLAGQPVDRPLPRLPGGGEPAPTAGRDGADRGRARAGGATRSAAALVAAAPPDLAAWLERVERGRGGWTVGLRGGPELRFGDLSRVAAKWQAASAVLADPTARGARYLDLRLPDRPAAGGLPAREPASGSPAREPSPAGLTNTQPELERLTQP